ncbi:hypothetical protein PTSG_00748 [Salpingoeca rosetta]|uniref:Uncharacterized protein n=1 Tax=Salpingoeca rosetta (strain ATCC 50818 / BSB-021) TaxID=946362 RepID=F2TXD0_SALR5|nr:uncharacterized protein PTSG_00748 [Salpingoeca rosetta]EGD76039.1 hypothetical protein PTSG_00748 [Salpingoeca rosetta]|eukprot:XP_004998214.1 hypothetical protein PTSG_00748 [Salpingoeca rosetta]
MAHTTNNHTMLLPVVAVAAVLALMAAQASASGAYGDPGKFDSYVLALSWTPEFCFQNPSSDECKSIEPSDFAASNFGLHGLWPQYNSSHDGHDWPQFCHADNTSYWKAISSVLNNVEQEFLQQWKKYAPAYAYSDLLTHEWQRHGSCALPAVLNAWKSVDALYDVQKAYFGYQMQLVAANPTPGFVTQALKSGKPVAVSDLQQHFGGAQYVGLQCVMAGNKAFLSQIELCYAKDATGRPTTKTPCPATVLNNSYDNNCVTTKQSHVYITKMK